MSHRKTLILFLAASLLLIPQMAAAQSLGEIARKLRQERKEHPEKAVKVYTNDNIPKSPELASGPAPEIGPAPAEPGKAQATPVPKTPRAPVESKMKTREYWQAKFRVARSVLAQAKEEQQLAGDQLSLLQIQQIRELNPNRSKQLKRRIGGKEGELKARREATEKAQEALDNLKKRFKESGAPEDWITGDSTP